MSNFDAVTKIYTMAHPETGEVRYVGKTVDTLERRLVGHASARNKSPVSVWVRELRGRGLRPEITLLTTAGRGWAAVESFWIERYRREGYRLLNVTPGGGGTVGHRHSPQARAKISAALRLRVRKPETAKKISESLKGHPVSDELRARMSAATKAHFADPEARKRASEKNSAYYSDPANRAAMSRAKKGIVISSEGRANLSAALKKYYSDPEARSKLVRDRAAARARR